MPRPPPKTFGTNWARVRLVHALVLRPPLHRMKLATGGVHVVHESVAAICPIISNSASSGALWITSLRLWATRRNHDPGETRPGVRVLSHLVTPAVKAGPAMGPV